MKVSVIVPVYKVEKYLDRCVRSILEQTYTNLELILVNDGSPDNCPKMCDEWAKRDHRVKVIHKQNKGVSEARNDGIKNAKGDYLLFVDSDDYVDENLSEFLDKAVKTNCDVCYSKVFGFIDNKYKDKIINVSSSEVKYFIKKKYPISCWGRLFKRDFIISNNLYFGNTINAEDLEWSSRIYCLVKKIAVINSSFYHYKQTEESASKSFRYNNFESFYLNVVEIYRIADKSTLNSTARKVLKANASGLLYYLTIRFGRFIGEESDYYRLMESNPKVFIKPLENKYFIVYLLVKVFGIKFVMKVSKRILR